MREAPIILPVFTTIVPLDFPLEGTFAFNKATDRQLEVTVRINEHQYFNMDFLNHDGYIMACCRWGHVLDLLALREIRRSGISPCVSMDRSLKT